MARQERKLEHWLMDPAILKKHGYALKPAKDSQVQQMINSCQHIGWSELATSIAQHPGLFEQEGVSPSLLVL